MYEIMVYDLNRKLDYIERFDNEEAYGDAFAEYCGLGYDVREYSPYRARAARRLGA